MHTSGLAHFDISGGNIMLHQNGESWDLKLLDFGLSYMIYNCKFDSQALNLLSNLVMLAVTANVMCCT